MHRVRAPRTYETRAHARVSVIAAVGLLLQGCGLQVKGQPWAYCCKEDAETLAVARVRVGVALCCCVAERFCRQLACGAPTSPEDEIILAHSGLVRFVGGVRPVEPALMVTFPMANNCNHGLMVH
eukprot:XP_001698824.1 predicted protein [Chlamydomonas reinhardtii]